MDNSLTDAVGWFSTLVLMATLIRQVVTQWRDKNMKGVSAWLFVGQLTSSIGFITYSAMVGNRIFVITNSLIAVVAIVGEWVYLRNKKQMERKNGQQ
jgi:MtN3 and saliva related transmembrane protein